MQRGRGCSQSGPRVRELDGKSSRAGVLADSGYGRVSDCKRAVRARVMISDSEDGAAEFSPEGGEFEIFSGLGGGVEEREPA